MDFPWRRQEATEFHPTWWACIILFLLKTVLSVFNLFARISFSIFQHLNLALRNFPNKISKNKEIKQPCKKKQENLSSYHSRFFKKEVEICLQCWFFYCVCIAVPPVINHHLRLHCVAQSLINPNLTLIGGLSLIHLWRKIKEARKGF